MAASHHRSVHHGLLQLCLLPAPGTRWCTERCQHGHRCWNWSRRVQQRRAKEWGDLRKHIPGSEQPKRRLLLLCPFPPVTLVSLSAATCAPAARQRRQPAAAPAPDLSEPMSPGGEGFPQGGFAAVARAVSVARFRGAHVCRIQRDRDLGMVLSWSRRTKPFKSIRARSG